MTQVAVSVLTTAAVIALAGCGSSSKPAYCSDRTNLNIATIQSHATSLVSAAKGDFPTQTSAIETSVDMLQSAIKALPSSPPASQIAAIALDAGNVVNSVKSFGDTSKSKCS